MKPLFLCLYLYFLLACPSLQAQDKQIIDSLKKRLTIQIHDTTRTLVYHQISRAYRHSKFDSAFSYAQKGLTLAQKIGFKKGIAANTNSFGTIELNKGNYLVALKYALEALKINEQLQDKAEIANTQNNIGEVYRLLRNYEKALQYYHEALKVNKEINYPLGIAINLNNIGETYTAQGKYTEALTYLNESLDICKTLKDKRRIALRLNNIGEIYEKQNQNTKAKQCFEEALNLFEQINNYLYQSVTLCNLANLSLKEGAPNITIAENAYQIALKMKAKREITHALKVIVAIHEKDKKYELAYQEYKKLNQYKDSMNIEEVDKQTKQLQYDYEITKKEKEILGLEHKQEMQVTYTIAFGIGILLLVILIFVQYFRNQNEKKNQQLLTEKNREIISRQEELIAQKDVIDEQKKDLEKAYQRMLCNETVLEKSIQKLRVSEASIKSSIKSAYVIQQAILPHHEKLDELLNDYFYLYLPKDIVSGDFWWVNEVEGKTFIATVDCTGHGVSGAFMTMIGNTLLDKTIRLRGIHNPAEVLEIMHEEVQIVLSQKENQNNNGMDMSVICLESMSKDEILVTFAGAKQTIYYTDTENKAQIFELKGTRKAIGGIQNESISFENQTITLKKGSWIYTGTDGLPDQNNVQRKRLGEKRLKELILQYHHQPAEIQKEAFEQALYAHMSQTEQRDDILWVGFRL